MGENVLAKGTIIIRVRGLGHGSSLRVSVGDEGFLAGEVLRFQPAQANAERLLAELHLDDVVGPQLSREPLLSHSEQTHHSCDTNSYHRFSSHCPTKCGALGISLEMLW